MCVHCNVMYGESGHPAIKIWGGSFRYHIGGPKNIFYIGRRGEGHPAPWVM